MTRVEFDWLKKYPAYRIEDDEDFVYLYKDNKVVATYSAKSKHLTQDFLQRKISKLEKLVKK